MSSYMWTRASSRRNFLEKAGLGFGALAAEFLLQRDGMAAARKATAKRVIFLFMHGGPSHVDTFDPKPLLAKLDGQPIPPSVGKVDFQFTNMEVSRLMASQRKFQQRGRSGIEI